MKFNTAYSPGASLAEPKCPKVIQRYKLNKEKHEIVLCEKEPFMNAFNHLPTVLLSLPFLQELKWEIVLPSIQLAVNLLILLPCLILSRKSTKQPKSPSIFSKVLTWTQENFSTIIKLFFPLVSQMAQPPKSSSEEQSLDSNNNQIKVEQEEQMQENDKTNRNECCFKDCPISDICDRSNCIYKL